MGAPPSNSRAQQAGSFGLLTALAAILVARASRALGPGIRDQPEVAGITGILVILLIAAGLTASIYALAAMRKAGTRGLLVKGLSGLLLNLLFAVLIVTGIATEFGYMAPHKPLSREAALQLPAVIQNATVLYHDQLQCRIEIPPGFTATPPSKMKPGTLYQYAQNSEDGNFRIILIQEMDGRLKHEPPTLDDLKKHRQMFPPNSDLDLYETSWNGHKLPGIIAMIHQPQQEMLVLLAQVPLYPRAIQLVVTTPAVNQKAAHELMNQLLASLKGTSSWR